MKELIVKKSIEINAPASKVWKVLLTPEFTRQYMFGCELISDLKKGSAIAWKGSHDGKIYVKGTIEKIVKEKILEFTTFDPNSEDHYEDIPSNYAKVTYELIEEHDHTILSVMQGDYAGITNGEKRHNETFAAWDIVLPRIKQLSENE